MNSNNIDPEIINIESDSINSNYPKKLPMNDFMDLVLNRIQSMPVISMKHVIL